MPRPKLRTPDLADRVLRAAVDSVERGETPTMRTVAASADTSPAALYELFGDKAGLLRAVCSEGFRMLATVVHAVRPTDDARADLIEVLAASRRFALAHPMLFEVMFAQPISELGPDEADMAFATSVRRVVMRHVDRCRDAGVVAGPRIDIAQALIATNRGLIAAELAGLLASSAASAERRWRFTIEALVEGLRPDPHE